MCPKIKLFGKNGIKMKFFEGKKVLFGQKISLKMPFFWSFQKKWDKNEVFWREGLKKIKNWGKTTFLRETWKNVQFLEKKGAKNEVYGEKRIKKNGSFS